MPNVPARPIDTVRTSKEISEELSCDQEARAQMDDPPVIPDKEE